MIPLKTHLLARVSQLAASAPELLATYRKRVDPLAEQRFQEALQTNSSQLWRRLAREAFLSSRGDDASWRWGACLMREGRLSAARRAWECLHPALRTPAGLSEDSVNALAGRPLWLALDRAAITEEVRQTIEQANSARSLGLVYPDTDLDLAEIRARLTWISILEGALPRAETELLILQTLHPQAQGAGRQTRTVGGFARCTAGGGEAVAALAGAAAGLAHVGRRPQPRSVGRAG